MKERLGNLPSPDFTARKTTSAARVSRLPAYYLDFAEARLALPDPAQLQASVYRQQRLVNSTFEYPLRHARRNPLAFFEHGYRNLDYNAAPALSGRINLLPMK